MSVLQSYVNKEIDCRSPWVDTMKLVKKYGKDGEEIITFEKEDLVSFQRSLGTYNNWTLEALKNAGINPASQNIHCGSSTRLDGLAAIDGILNDIDEFLTVPENNEEKSE